MLPQTPARPPSTEVGPTPTQLLTAIHEEEKTQSKYIRRIYLIIFWVVFGPLIIAVITFTCLLIAGPIIGGIYSQISSNLLVNP